MAKVKSAYKVKNPYVVSTKAKTVRAETPDIIPIVDYNENEVFVDAKGGLIDIFQIQCKDLDAARDYDVFRDVYGFTLLHKCYTADYKIITMNYPVETAAQVERLSRIEQSTENPIYLKELAKEKGWLQTAHESYDAREFYLMVFAKDDDAYKRQRNMLNSVLMGYGLIEPLRLDKKVLICSKLFNMNALLGKVEEQDPIPRGITPGKNYNAHLLSAIQPQGGISFTDERIVRKGDGHEACIHIYKYPSKVSFSWLSKIIMYNDTIATIDVGTEEQLKAIDALDKSIEEQLSRYSEARYGTERMNAQRIYGQLEDLHQSIMDMGEVVKLVHVRIYAYAREKSKLEDNIGKILADIESKGYKAAVFLGETEDEWKSLLLPYRKQEMLPHGRQGQGIPAETLGLGHPFNFSSLIDDGGLYWGHTATNGSVIWNPYLKNKVRLSYGSVIYGVMGAGKSSAIKDRIRKDLITNNYVRGFAINNEFAKIINYLGGEQISLDGSDGILNILHVNKSAKDEGISFLAHLDRVANWFRFLAPQVDDTHLVQLKSILRLFYDKTMGYNINDRSCQITGLSGMDYPTLSELLAFVEKDRDHIINYDEVRAIRDIKLERIERLTLYLDDAVKNMGRIFDGHTTLPNIYDQPCVFYNMENLRNLDSKVFDAQLYTAFSGLMDNMIYVGLPQKERIDAGTLRVEDARFYGVYVDESHNFVSAKKPHAIRVVDSFSREARKYLAGVHLVAHSIRDHCPTDATQEGMDQMKNLFSFAQYKMIFRQGTDAVETLRDVFGDDIPANDLQAVPTFQQGECILAISGANAIRFQIDLSEEDKALYTGGA